MTDPVDHSTDEHVVDDDERIVGGLVAAGGAPIDEARPVFWEARTY